MDSWMVRSSHCCEDVRSVNVDHFRGGSLPVDHYLIISQVNAMIFLWCLCLDGANKKTQKMLVKFLNFYFNLSGPHFLDGSTGVFLAPFCWLALDRKRRLFAHSQILSAKPWILSLSWLRFPHQNSSITKTIMEDSSSFKSKHAKNVQITHYQERVSLRRLQAAATSVSSITPFLLFTLLFACIFPCFHLAASLWHPVGPISRISFSSLTWRQY